MVVEVEHQHALALEVRVGAGCYGDVVEHAEPHPARGFGVMTGRPHQRERAAAPVDGGVERDERRARGARRAVVRARIDERVAGDQLRYVAVFECGAGTADQLDICRRVHARQFVGPGIARIDALTEHAAAPQFLGHDAHAIRGFRMRHAVEVRGETVVVGDEHRLMSWSCWKSSWARPSAGGRSQR